MKLAITVACLATLAAVSAFNPRQMETQQPAKLVGAWQMVSGENETTLICSGKYYSVAIYNQADRTFTGTYGGSYLLEGDRYRATIEFNSMDPGRVGDEFDGTFSLQGNSLTLQEDSGSSEWRRIDDGGPGKLTGAWLITGRINGGQMSKMTPGARRTMKIMSGTRFQWIAYNVETKELSGTGGGTYTTTNGKYTENIQFFSRDNSRVGASLTFDFSLEDGAWRHKGKSSKGDPIDEVWTRREKIGL